MANVNFLRRHRICTGQRLRPLNRVPNFYYKYLCYSLIYAYDQSSMHLRPSNRVISLFCPNNRSVIAQIVLMWS